MLTDIYTIVWKEFKEIFLQRENRRNGMLSMLVIIGVVGVFLPLQSGLDWLESPVGLLAWSWLPLFLVMGSISDSIAGERERHTLETLLSSCLSDRSILFGKMIASILYGWGTAMVCAIMGVITVNLANWNGTIHFFPPLFFILAVIASLLVTTLVTNLGLLVSLRAKTVKQAYQSLSVSFMILWFVPMLGLQFAPGSLKMMFLQFLKEINLWQVALIFAALLIAGDAILLAVNMQRYQRSRLVLD